MGYRLSKIYTRMGDDGKTQIEPGKWIAKNSQHIETLGTLDELNCLIGLILANPIHDKEIVSCLTQIQHDLFNLGGELCPPHHIAITSDKVTQLENRIDQWNEALPPLKEFILPQGSLVTTTCHLARAVCRRAERNLVALLQEKKLSLEGLKYLNRLSDLLFVLARVFSAADKTDEVLWEHEKRKK